jgi:hypothetical protein
MTNRSITRTSGRRWAATLTVAALACGLAVTGAQASVAAPASVPASAPASAAAPAALAPLTNLAHLDFLLDQASPPELAEHTTYRLAEEPALTLPWTYADARDGGTFQRVGGGPLDPATGYWGQGAYNSDDIARAAVVYLRDWRQTGSATSRASAYELLRSVAYLQTSSGPNAGNVVLWMQPDGTLNPSPEPVELPDPSDSGESYWLARSLWAFGEGYAAFAADDPQFAGFLQQRLQLGVAALERDSLSRYGQYADADGAKVPAWLIVDGADASAEAVLGLSAYSAAAPSDAAARSALAKLAEGIAKMGAGDTRTWPYGAILPWAQSRSMWHAWSSQMPAALAAASTVLGNAALLTPAVADSAGFVPTLLTAGGPDNAWYPTPVERVQIAYGADSRLQSLLAVADAADRPGFDELAGMMGAWYFGMNKAGEPVYNPATGVTYDGVQADGSVNRNSGAESTIHGLLSMIALDAHPDVAARAVAVNRTTAISGLTTVEAEAATSTTGAVVTPESAWTGESQYGGGAYLALDRGEKATVAIPGAGTLRHVEPVTFQPNPGSASSLWTAKLLPLGLLRDRAGAQGITAVPGVLLPQPTLLPVPAQRDAVTVTGVTGTVALDAVIVRPLLSRLVLEGDAGQAGSTELVHSTEVVPQRTTVGSAGATATLRSYDKTGALVEERTISGSAKVTVRAGGFVVVER